MTKPKKQRETSSNKIHDKKNMIVLGLTVAAILIFIISTQ